MKSLEMDINYCGQCPACHPIIGSRTGFDKYYCWLLAEVNIIWNPNEIPGWCPLPDKEGIKE